MLQYTERVYALASLLSGPYGIQGMCIGGVK